jgi:hypothetical protein
MRRDQARYPHGGMVGARSDVRALPLTRPHQDLPSEGVREMIAVAGERLEHRLHGLDESAFLGCEEDCGAQISDHPTAGASEYS